MYNEEFYYEQYKYINIYSDKHREILKQLQNQQTRVDERHHLQAQKNLEHYQEKSLAQILLAREFCKSLTI